MSDTVLGETTCPVEILPQSTQRMNRAIVLAYPGDVDLVTVKPMSNTIDSERNAVCRPCCPAISHP